MSATSNGVAGGRLTPRARETLRPQLAEVAAVALSPREAGQLGLDGVQRPALREHHTGRRSLVWSIKLEDSWVS